MKVLNVRSIYESDVSAEADGTFLGIHDELGYDVIAAVIGAYPDLCVDFGGGEKDILCSVVVSACGGSAYKLSSAAKISRSDAARVIELCSEQ